MDTFTVAMTVLMAISALGQLAVSIAMLSANKRRAIKNWIAWRVDVFLWIILSSLSFLGLLRFLLTDAPSKDDHYLLAASAAGAALSASIFLIMYLVRYASQLHARINRLESVILYPSEPSKEGSGG